MGFDAASALRTLAFHAGAKEPQHLIVYRKLTDYTRYNRETWIYLTKNLMR